MKKKEVLIDYTESYFEFSSSKQLKSFERISKKLVSGKKALLLLRG